MVASSFAHALGQLESGILRCLDGVAVLHAEHPQYVCGKLGLTNGNIATDEILINLHAQEVLQPIEVCHLESLA